MQARYKVQLEKESFVFSAAHFITFHGDVCERLHGHNYGVRVEVEGPLDENQYVVDFIALRDTVQGLVAQLDHHMLLPTQHPQIHVTADTHEVDVRFADRRWLFPRQDCVLLPIANTTAERLAWYLGQRLLAELRHRTGFCPELLRVAVDENHGQWGECELRAGDVVPLEMPVAAVACRATTGPV